MAVTKSEKAAAIVAALEEQYPEAVCSLNYAEPYRLLIAVRLAAQCTDERVNKTTPILFARYATLSELAKADAEEVAQIVRPCGLGNTKARDIVAMCGELIGRFEGRVPDTMGELLSLTGVGRKTANLILGDVYGKPAVVCDTHCIRITNLMGLASSKNPDAVERSLREVLPMDKANDFCHRLVLHGRAVCRARSPACRECRAVSLCDYGRKRDAGVTPK
ncbi:MAG: endonuclease III [Oscillospiraceae bacterium]|jgi:endonuclease-3|nr:endonuclease III [Oscillospiraceae bacterium]